MTSVIFLKFRTTSSSLIYLGIKNYSVRYVWKCLIKIGLNELNILKAFIINFIINWKKIFLLK